MNEQIKKWYLETYETDELGNAINDGVRFVDLFNCLENCQDVYELLGDGIDSVIRERAFEKLAEIMNVDYETIYYKWLLAD